MKATGDDISVTEMSCAELFSGAPVAILHVPADCTGPLNVVRYLAVIRLTAVQPRRRGRGLETAEQAEECQGRSKNVPLGCRRAAKRSRLTGQR